MRKVFLDDLPRKGGQLGFIDWNKCKGMKVSFVYDDIEGEVELIDYISCEQKLIIKYNNRIFWDKPILRGNFQQCRLGWYLGMITSDFKIEIGQVFKDSKRDLFITDREYRNGNGQIDKKTRYKWYKYTCNKCGWTEGWITEAHLIKGNGCSCCNGKSVIEGINTIWDTDRWMCDLGVSEEDAKRYTRASDKKVEITCPDCGVKKNMRIADIYEKRIIRCTCGDGFSYPEKILCNLLRQLEVNFKAQLSKKDLKWCNKYRYDFYLPEYNMIIETHGNQHYEETKGFLKTLAEEQENDKLKKELALKNGIEHYVSIDCRYSYVEYIKNNVLNSKLNELFDLSQINWNECEEFALKNIVKEVCEYWNEKEEWETTYTISESNEWGIKSASTISNYLKKGAKLGWTNYDPKEEYIKGVRKLNKTGKSIEIFKNDISLGVFESVTELERQSEELFGVKLLSCATSRVCIGKKPQYKGFTFKYTKES